MSTLAGLLLLLAIATGGTVFGAEPRTCISDLGSCVHLSQFTPHDLRCQHLRGVPAIDVPHPAFSWKLAANVDGQYRGLSQHFYRVQVGTAVRSTAADGEGAAVNGQLDQSQLVWDSGAVASDNHYAVMYSGAPLQSRTTYHWKVYWSNKDGTVSAESDVASFHMALMSQDDWQGASWVAAVEATTAPLLYTTISLPEGLQESHIYVSGLGWFTMTVNGKVVTPFSIGPGWTTYHKEVYYVAVDVTSQLSGAQSAQIAVQLGLGWRDPVFASKDGKYPDDKYPRVLRMQMSMKHSAGLTVVGTDESWHWQETPIMADSLYNGETYNASMKNLPQPLRNATAVTGPAGKMTVEPIPQILVNRTLKPINITQPQANTWVVDFGENLSGRCRLTIRDSHTKTNQAVTLHYAEILMHEPYGAANGLPYFGNLRGAKATDTYIINGNGQDPEVYEPTFTYHGFRYVQITGLPGTLTTDDIEMVHFYTALTRSGTFQTSSKTMNAIQRNVWSGHESNSMSVLTDCDQRDERLGWMGDAGLSSDAYSLNFDMSAFFSNMLHNIEIEQGDDGSIPDIVPWVRGGGKPGDPSWSAAYPQIAWCMMHYYGDSGVATKHTTGLMKYVNEMMTRTPEDFTKYPGSYGDWCPPAPNKKVPTSVPSAFSFTNNLRQLAEIFKSNTSAAAILTQTADDYTKRFEKAFTTSGGQYLDDLQVSYALGLTLDMPSDSSQPSAVKFINSIHAAKSHLTTGIIGSKFVLPVLSNLKQGDLALQIVEQTDYPSWGWMVFNDIEPATAIWELWDAYKEGPGMNSRNHHMFSSVSGWMRTHAVGFHIDGAGMKALRFEPASVQGLSWVNASYDEPKHVEYRWQRHGGTHCAKSAEGRSAVNTNLPEVDPLHLTCGAHGGHIQTVDFASFGKPQGSCGFFEADESCHNTTAQNQVEDLCIGKSECHLPVGADFWGNTCRGSKRLYVQVTCSAAHTVTADIVVPVGSVASVAMPTAGTENVILMESGSKLWTGNAALQTSHPGIDSVDWHMETDSIKVHVKSGHYSFQLTGDSPALAGARKYSNEGDAMHMQCPPGHRITGVSHVHFGHHLSNHTRSESRGCHVPTAHMLIAGHCLNRGSCTVPVDSDTLGNGCKRHSDGGNDARRQLSAVFQCSARQRV